MQNLSILNKNIHIFNGLYSLNDVHKASGGGKKHQPAFFMRNTETKELIAEIQHSANLQSDNIFKKINGGVSRGTFVCKELVYRYAMWISPKFALLVIRVFDEYATGNQQPKLDNLSTVDSRVPLKDAVNKLVAVKKIPYNTAWKIVHQWTGAENAKSMTEAQVEKGLRYVHELTVSNLLEGELLPREETPKLPAHIADMHFDLQEDADYKVVVRDGKARRLRMMYCIDPHDKKQNWWFEA